MTAGTWPAAPKARRGPGAGRVAHEMRRRYAQPAGQYWEAFHVVDKVDCSRSPHRSCSPRCDVRSGRRGPGRAFLWRIRRLRVQQGPVVRASGRRLHAAVWHLRPGPADLPPNLPAGVRLRRQDLFERLRAACAPGRQVPRRRLLRPAGPRGCKSAARLWPDRHEPILLPHYCPHSERSGASWRQAEPRGETAARGGHLSVRGLRPRARDHGP